MGIDPWIWFRSLDIDAGDGPCVRKQQELYLSLGASGTNINISVTWRFKNVVGLDNTIFTKIGLQLLIIRTRVF